MAIITIRGQMGSGADWVGRLVADRLHFEYVDREIIASVAKKLKIKTHEVRQKEMPPSTLFGRIAEVMASSYAVNPAVPDITSPAMVAPPDDATYLKTLVQVIKGIAAKQAIVIRGRGSQFILKDIPDAFHVLIIAPLPLRVSRVVEEHKLQEEAARKEIGRYDSSRRAFIKRYFKAELEDPANYDLTINTARLSFESAANLIVQALGLKS